MKKWVFLGLVIILVAVMLGCPGVVETPSASPSEKPMPEITTASSEIKEGLKLEISLPKVSYQLGEILEATVSLINTTPEAISFSTRTSQLFDLIIKGPERERWWSEDKVFLQVITPRHIPAKGELSEVLSLEINQARGDFYLTGVTVFFDLKGERIQLQTTPLKIEVD